MGVNTRPSYSDGVPQGEDTWWEKEEMATQKKTQKKNILKQYRKLIAVLPNICSKSRVSKQSVVEEAIIYIEELQKQLVSTIQTGEGGENWKDNKTNDDQ